MSEMKPEETVEEMLARPLVDMSDTVRGLAAAYPVVVAQHPECSDFLTYMKFMFSPIEGQDA